jgi:release factor glutamine methyltransferase
MEKTKEYLWLLNEKYNEKECPEFLEDLKRLESGEPIDYIIGFTNFLGAKIDLSFRPLIPRQDTEFWLEKAINDVAGRGLQPRSERLELPSSSVYTNTRTGLQTPSGQQIGILDLFAGSGCIGIALLKNLPDVFVDFGEKDPLIVKQIEKNLEINTISPERFCVYETDVFQNIPAKKYDFIFANPPYVAHDRKDHVAKSVFEHEPHLAIFAEDEGLFFIKKLLAEAPNFLTKNGKIFIEFDQWQKEKIEELVNNSKFTGEFWKDQNEKWRVVMCELK